MPDLQGARELYEAVGAGSLVGDYERTRKALALKTQQLEEYPNTPYTRDHAETAEAMARILRELGDELRAWHIFLRKTAPHHRA